MATGRSPGRRRAAAAATPSPAPATTVCDNESVGVIITDHHNRLLMITRATPPVGRAPVAGHRDNHGTVEDTARDEVNEEVGLTVTDLTVLIPRHWRDNICRRRPGPLGIGHYWTIFEATVAGEVHTDPAEAVDAHWYTQGELQDLADRTVAYATGALSIQRFTSDPGIQPVWMPFLHLLGLIRITNTSLAAVQNAARHL